jgi:hypothetical protein
LCTIDGYCSLGQVVSAAVQVSCKCHLPILSTFTYEATHGGFKAFKKCPLMSSTQATPGKVNCIKARLMTQKLCNSH